MTALPTALPPVTPVLEEQIEIRPQPGPQAAFLSTWADIGVYGGARGAGKTFSLLMDPLRFINLPGFNATIFRRTSPEIRLAGGLWSESRRLYRQCDGEPNQTRLDWSFPSGATIAFAGIEHDNDLDKWLGAQIGMIGFDQIELFTWEQFTGMLACNRTECGIKGYVRATCNPDPDHWLRTFMAWWIDEISGEAIAEHSGVVRYFAISGDTAVWAETQSRHRSEDSHCRREAQAELSERLGDNVGVLSFTFIPGRVEDNQILLSKDPTYLTKLKSLPRVKRERFWNGNWNVRESAGDWFQADWFEVVDAAPGFVDCIRYWDRAATDAKTAKVTGSWTAGVKIGKTPTGLYYVVDVDRFQGSPLEVATRIKNIASQDGPHVRVGIEQDPGQAGVAEAQGHVRGLAGFNAKVNTVRERKGVRAKPFSAQCEAGNVKVLRGAWNLPYLKELQNFDGTPNCMADQVDASSGAFLMLTAAKEAGTW